MADSKYFIFATIRYTPCVQNQFIYKPVCIKWASSHIYNFSITQNCRKNVSNLDLSWHMVLMLFAKETDPYSSSHHVHVMSLRSCNLVVRLSRFTRSIRPQWAQSPQALEIFPQSKQASSCLTDCKYSRHLLQSFLPKMISLFHTEHG